MNTTTIAALLPTPDPGPDDTEVCDSRCRAFSQALSERIQGSVTGGTIGFYVQHFGGPVVAELNERTPFYPASAIKAVHLLHAMRWASERLDEATRTQIPVYADSCTASGQSRLRPLEQLLSEMMVDSNNQSTNAVQDFFGVAQLSETMAAAGMIDSEIHHKFGCGGPSNDPANQTTAVDLAGIYRGVADGTLLSSTERDYFLATMIDATDLIPAINATNPTSAEAPHLYLKEGWYDTTLAVGGLLVRPGGIGGVDQWAFVAFVDDAVTIAPGFEITDLLSHLWDLGGFET